MRKKLFALLPGLALLLTLLAVAAWGAEPPKPFSSENIDPSVKTIKVVCSTETDHTVKSLSLPDDCFDDKSLSYDYNVCKYVVTIDTDKVLAAYNDLCNRCNYGTHIVIGPNETRIELDYDADTYKYVKSDSSKDPSITVMCLRPSKGKVDQLLGPVTLQCAADSSHNVPCNFDDIRSNATYDVALGREENGVYYCTLTVNADVFREYASTTGHYLTGDTTRQFAIKYDTDSSTWSLVDDTAEKNLTFAMSCAQPAVPAYQELLRMHQNDLKAQIYLTTGYISDPYFTLTEDMIDFKNAEVYVGTWGDYYCDIPLKANALIKAFNAKSGYLLLNCGYIRLNFENGSWLPSGYEADIIAAPAPTVEGLGLTANVVCADGSHALRSFTPAKDQLTFTPMWDEDRDCYTYQVSLSSAAADSLLAQYGADVGKTHTRQAVSTVTICWDYDEKPAPTSLENGIAVQAGSNTNGWQLKDSSAIITITAACKADDDDDNGGSNRRPAQQPALSNPQTTVTSAKTFDGGVAVYMGLALLSLSGTALTVHKRRKF